MNGWSRFPHKRREDALRPCRKAGASGLRCVLGAAALTLLVTLAGCGPRSGTDGDSRRGGGVTIRMSANPISVGDALLHKLVRAYENKTGHRILVTNAHPNVSLRLTQYLQQLGSRSPDIDIYQIDVIWPGMLADHLVDLAPYLGSERAAFLPQIIENNTVEGRLVAVPWFTDCGLLYYRTDLLKKYGFDAPPATWDELESMSRIIQDGERAEGQGDFWGFLFAGDAQENLTCMTVEWLASMGAGQLLTPDGTRAAVNDKWGAVFERAHHWIGSISPLDSAELGPEETRLLFQAGKSAFLRQWTYTHPRALSEEDSVIRDVFDITKVPAGDGGHVSNLGGWQLSVSQYSNHPEVAADFVVFLTSEEAQRIVATEGGYPPTRAAVYKDTAVIARRPHLPDILATVETAVARPSRQTRGRYNEVSSVVYSAVNRVLRGEITGDDAARQIETRLNRILDDFN